MRMGNIRVAAWIWINSVLIREGQYGNSELWRCMQHFLFRTERVYHCHIFLRYMLQLWDHIHSSFSGMILVLWVLKSPELVSYRIQCGMPNAPALFQVIKSLTLLTRHKKIVTFPLWGEISVGVGHAVNQPQVKERKMYRLVICSLDRDCKGWGMDVQTKISKWTESLNLNNIHLIGMSFFMSAFIFLSEFSHCNINKFHCL